MPLLSSGMPDALAGRLSRGHVLITGAGGAVGRALAGALAERGARLALIERAPAGDAAAAAAALAGAQNGLTLHADLSSPESAAAAVAEATRSLGPPAVLVNAAGGFAVDDPESGDAAGLEAMLDTNLRTAVNATAAVLPGMLERRDGAIVAIGAAAALAPAPGRKAYAASKAALNAYFASLAAEVSAAGVVVGVLHPMGTIDTPANRSAMPGADASKWIRLAAVCSAIMCLAASEAGGTVKELRLHGS